MVVIGQVNLSKQFLNIFKNPFLTLSSPLTSFLAYGVHSQRCRAQLHAKGVSTLISIKCLI